MHMIFAQQCPAHLSIDLIFQKSFQFKLDSNSHVCLFALINMSILLKFIIEP